MFTSSKRRSEYERDNRNIPKCLKTPSSFQNSQNVHVLIWPMIYRLVNRTVDLDFIVKLFLARDELVKT